MAQDQVNVKNETGDDGITGYADQPAPKGPASSVLDHDYVFKSGIETITRLDELIVQVDSKANKPTKGAEWLAMGAKDLRDRLVEAKKPVIELLNHMRRNGPPAQPEDNTLLLELFGSWKVVDPLISEADLFLGN